MRCCIGIRGNAGSSIFGVTSYPNICRSLSKNCTSANATTQARATFLSWKSSPSKAIRWNTIFSSRCRGRPKKAWLTSMCKAPMCVTRNTRETDQRRSPSAFSLSCSTRCTTSPSKSRHEKAPQAGLLQKLNRAS